MSTDLLNIPNGMVLVPVQLQSGGTGSVPGSSPDTRLLGFKRRSPQALGTVQIMVAVMLFLDGVTSGGPYYHPYYGYYRLTAYYGVFIWAPLSYILAGSFTVAADRSMSRCMITGSMMWNIVAAVVSFPATILYGIDGSFLGVQCVFNLLVFIISICLSVFGCKATCYSEQTLIMQAVVIGNHLPEVSAVMSPATPSPDAPPSYSEVDHTPPEPLLPKAVGSAVG